MSDSASILITVIVFLCILTVWRFTYIRRAPGEICMCDDDMQCMTASDGSKYCVRKLSNDKTERTKGEMQRIAESLSRVTSTCSKVVAYMTSRHSKDPRVIRMVSKFDKHAICEIRLESSHVAFNESKGRKVAFCMSKAKEEDDLVDDHTLEFVALHELAHTMTISTDHTDEYWDNFKFILDNAEQAGLHIPIDYGQRPQEYCGAPIQDNPFYSRRTRART